MNNIIRQYSTNKFDLFLLMRNVKLKLVQAASAALQMVQLHVQLSTLTEQILIQDSRVDWVGCIVNITVQFEDGVSGDEGVQTEPEVHDSVSQRIMK
jgi:hypothetical protein